jgi:hypothetical protein
MRTLCRFGGQYQDRRRWAGAPVSNSMLGWGSTTL